MVIALCLVIALVGWSIASRAPDRFGRMVAAGITGMALLPGPDQHRRSPRSPTDHRDRPALRQLRIDRTDLMSGRGRRPGQHRPARHRQGNRDMKVVRGTWYVVRRKKVVRGRWYVVACQNAFCVFTFYVLRRKFRTWPDVRVLCFTHHLPRTTSWFLCTHHAPRTTHHSFRLHDLRHRCCGHRGACVSGAGGW